MDLTVPIEIPAIGDERRKSWAKVVERVDPGKATGWAYAGAFIATGGIQDVAVPSVVLVYGEHGSRSNPRPEARVYIANTDGTLTHHATATGRAWARTLRDTVANLLREDLPQPSPERPWDPRLMGYSDEALREELGRRNAAG